MHIKDNNNLHLTLIYQIKNALCSLMNEYSV